MANKGVDDIMEIVRCALSNEENMHICDEAAILSCKHYACKLCIKRGIECKTITCNICNTINKNETNKHSFNDTYESILNKNINHIFTSILEHYKNKFDKLKQMVIESDERVDLQVDFVKDEVQVRIESLKIGLDKIGDSMNEQLEDIRVKWKNDLQESNKKLINEANIEIELNNLENRIANNEDLTKNRLYADQNKLKIVNEAIKVLKRDGAGSLQLVYDEKKDLKNVVGGIIYMFPPISEMDRNIIDRIKKNNVTTINLVENDAPLDLCVTQNGDLLQVNYGSQKISVYDKNFTRTRSVPLTHRSVICVATDDLGNLYASDHDSHLIVKYDSGFKQLKEFGSTQGSGMNQLSWPSGLCFYNDSVFVCDCENDRVQKFNSDLEYQDSFNVGYKPWYIRNINNVACVRDRHAKAIRFYNLDGFTLLREYSEHNGCIGVSERCFYEYYRLNKTFYIYNAKGDLVEEIKSNGLDFLIREEFVYTWDSLCIYDSKLILACRYNRKILTI